MNEHPSMEIPKEYLRNFKRVINEPVKKLDHTVIIVDEIPPEVTEKIDRRL